MGKTRSLEEGIRKMKLDFGSAESGKDENRASEDHRIIGFPQHFDYRSIPFLPRS
jgi:hypothetical protein